MNIASLILAALATPVVAATTYLVILTLLSRRARAPDPGPPHLRFDFVVPAHDEARGIGSTIDSLLSVDYPSELCRVIVVADNCTDDTAARARAKGVLILERDEPSKRGKGYALAHAFDHILEGGATSAVVVVDADTVVSNHILRALSAHLDRGASAVQADYAIRNANASWRTRLMAVAFASVHMLRGLARERLRVSCGLRGNGMCFTTSLLAAVPYDAFSIVEDLEYGIRIGLAGHRVHFAPEAHVYGDMPTGEQSSRTQRQRWESGRARMTRLHAVSLLVRGVRARDRIALDLAFDLLVPPLATLVALTAVGLTASAILSWHSRHVLAGGYLWLGAAIGLLAYGLRGLQLSSAGARGLLDLLYVPAYIVWKLAARLRPTASRRGEWVRTAREEKESR